MRKTRVYLPDVEPFRSFEAYLAEGRWDGPYFTRETADEVMAWANDTFGNEHIDIRMTMKRLDDPLVVTRYEITEQDEHVSEVWPCVVKYDGGEEIAWPIGTGWTWSEVTPDMQLWEDLKTWARREKELNEGSGRLVVSGLQVLTELLHRMDLAEQGIPGAFETI